jgi:hypothetical protein
MRVKLHTRFGNADLMQYTHAGVTLSVGIGEHHYCEGRQGISDPQNAEMAIWKDGQDMERIGNDQVAAFVDLSHLPMLLKLLMQDKSETRVKRMVNYLENLSR